MTTFIGISFPFRKGSTSFPETSTDEVLIRESMIQIMLTGLGERVMRPNFGSSAYALVFENNDPNLEERVSADIKSSIGKFEPRVIIRSVDVFREDSSITATVNYVVRLTQTSATLQVSIPTS